MVWLESPRAEFWAARPLKGARSATRDTAERRVRIDRRWIEVRVGFRLSELTTEPHSGYRTPPRRGVSFPSSETPRVPEGHRDHAEKDGRTGAAHRGQGVGRDGRRRGEQGGAAVRLVRSAARVSPGEGPAGD